MTGLHQWLMEQRTKHCALSGVAIFIGVIDFGLILALHLKG